MEQSIEQRNDLNNLRKIYDLFEVIKTKHTFQTEEGIKSKQELDAAIDHFIKPFIVETGKNIKNGNETATESANTGAV